MKKLYIQKKVLGLMLLSLVFNFSLPGQNIYTVAKTSDPDPFDNPYYYNDALCDTAMYGTLQWAIRKANDSPDSSLIVFNISGSGQHTIILNNYLPVLGKQITIDGTSQPGYSGEPLIIIDGQNDSTYKQPVFMFNGSSDNSEIKGILIKNFPLGGGISCWRPNIKIKNNIIQSVGDKYPVYDEQGNIWGYYRNLGIYIAAPNCVIQGNIFGTNITETQTYISKAEAIYLISQYLPADNCLIGGSGVNEANIVTNSGYGGYSAITVQNGKHNRISRNKIYNNPKGIQLLIYAGPAWWGNEGKSAPTIDSLTPTGILHGTSQPNDVIEIFGSSGPQNANEYIITTTTDATGNWSAVMSNFNWLYFIATATDAANNTSELSNAYEIIIPPPMATCATATEIIITPVCIPQIYYGQTTDLWFKFIPDTANVELFVSYPATAAAQIDKMYAYEGACDSLNLYAQTNNDTLYLYDLTPGNTYYLKLHTAQTGYFNICGQKGDTLFIPPDYTVEPPAGNGAYYVNKGQIIDIYNNLRPDIKYYSVNTSPALYLSDSAVSFVFAHIDTIAATPNTMQRVDMKLAGNTNFSRTYQREPVPGYLNYYLGHCPQGVTDVKGYNRIVYPDVYPNINMQCYSNAKGVKFYFVIKPGGRVNEITLKFDGADAVSINGNGNLVIQTSIGSIEFDHAQCYKVNPAGNVVPMPNQGDYVQLSPTEIGFDVQQSAAPMPLIIMVDRGHAISAAINEPGLCWSTYLGGSQSETAYGIALDNGDNQYITGETTSPDFPIYLASQTGSYGSQQTFLTKFDMNHKRAWCTFFGGSDDQAAYDVKVRSNGDIYICGHTVADDFPVQFKNGAYNDSLIAGTFKSDGFIAQFDTSGYRIWATYFGGSGEDRAYSLDFDANNNLYVAGSGKEANFPTKYYAGAYNQPNAAGLSDAFIARFDGMDSLIWCSFYGGASADWASTIKTDNPNNVFICGGTYSSDFPVFNNTSGAFFDDSLGGTIDDYIVKFSPAGQRLWATYIGGSNTEYLALSVPGPANRIAFDSNNDIYFVGSTNSSNFPLKQSSGFFDNTFASYDGYIMKFSGLNYDTLWSTLISGTGNTYINSIDITADNRIFIAGYTSDNNLPVHQQSSFYYQDSISGSSSPSANDAFLMAFNNNNDNILCTYFGGYQTHPDGEAITDIVIYKSSLYATGYTTTIDTNGIKKFPMYDPGNNAYFDSTFNGGYQDVFITEFCIGSISAIDEIVNNNIDFLVYPNPANNQITVQFSAIEGENAKFYIYSIEGKLISSFDLKNANTINIDISKLNRGLYLLQIKTNKWQKAVKFSKM